MRVFFWPFFLGLNAPRTRVSTPAAGLVLFTSRCAAEEGLQRAIKALVTKDVDIRLLRAARRPLLAVAQQLGDGNRCKQGRSGGGRDAVADEGAPARMDGREHIVGLPDAGSLPS